MLICSMSEAEYIVFDEFYTEIILLFSIVEFLGLIL